MQEFNDIMSNNGLPAFIVAIGYLLKYGMTIVFLGTGIVAFTKYINKE